MTLRGRFFGYIARESGEGVDGPAIVDFGDLVRKLILFDELVVESHNLKEFAPIAQKFGYDGAKALLESPRFRVLKDRAFIVDIGQAPTPQRPILPLGSYSIGPARVTPPREYLSSRLHLIDDVPGLSGKQAQKLRHIAGSRLRTIPEEALRVTQDQIAQDFEANSSSLRASIAKRVRSQHGIEVGPHDFYLRLEHLGGTDWRAETDLGRLTDLAAKDLHDVVGTGLAGSVTINLQLALMRSLTAIGSLQVDDLPLFSERLEFLIRDIDPAHQEARFDRVRQIGGLPDVSGDPAIHDVDMAELLEITTGSEVRTFREWLRTSDDLSDEELADVVRPVRDSLAGAIRGRAAKAVRFAVTTGVGVVVPPLGLGLSALDAFLVEELLPEPGPTAFLSKLAGSVF